MQPGEAAQSFSSQSRYDEERDRNVYHFPTWFKRGYRSRFPAAAHDQSRIFDHRRINFRIRHTRLSGLAWPAV